MGYETICFESDAVFLVTGGAGFIGSNLCEALLKKGHEVRCLDNLSTGRQENVDIFKDYSKYTFIRGDIRDYNTCLNASKGVHYVLHQAAWGSVPRSVEMPLIYNDNNINGTLNMMEASKQNGIRKFVYASSSSVYGDDPILPKKEGCEGNLLSPYALTKRANEEYGNLYSRLYELDTYGLRYFNVFGKRQDPMGSYAAVIPKFIMQLMNNEQPTINGDGSQSRDFTFIENVIDANLKACKAPSEMAGQVFNIACGNTMSLMDIYHKISGILDKDIDPIFGPLRPGDIKHSNADIQKAKDILGFSPDWSFELGIRSTIDWYKDRI